MQKVGNPTHFYCSTPRVHHSPDCIIEPVAEDDIKEVVLSVLESHANLFLAEKKAQKQLMQSSDDNLKRLTDAMQSFEIQKRKLYESYKDERIGKGEYLSKRDKLNKDICALTTELSLLQEKAKSSNVPKVDDNQKEAWHLLSKTNELDYKIVDALVDKIIVYNGNKIEVKLKYADGFNTSVNHCQGGKRKKFKKLETTPKTHYLKMTIVGFWCCFSILCIAY